MPIAPEEHDGITGVTFTSDGHRLLGTLYLARGDEPKPTALLLHGWVRLLFIVYAVWWGCVFGVEMAIIVRLDRPDARRRL